MRLDEITQGVCADSKEPPRMEFWHTSGTTATYFHYRIAISFSEKSSTSQMKFERR